MGQAVRGWSMAVRGTGRGTTGGSCEPCDGTRWLQAGGCPSCAPDGDVGGVVGGENVGPETDYTPVGWDTVRVPFVWRGTVRGYGMGRGLVTVVRQRGTRFGGVSARPDGGWGGADELLTTWGATAVNTGPECEGGVVGGENAVPMAG